MNVYIFFSLWSFFTSGIRWLKDSFVSLHLLCLYCLNVVFSCLCVEMLQLWRFIAAVSATEAAGMNHRRRWKWWQPKLSQSIVHGVVYRCHCIAVSIYQLLPNMQEGWKLSILLFSVNQSVGVMADKCFSCCCLMLFVSQRGKVSVIPVFPPQIAAMFLFYFFLI